jgi:hypothetical protein
MKARLEAVSKSSSTAGTSGIAGMLIFAICSDFARRFLGCFI